MSQYFPKPFRSFDGNVNIKVDLSNCNKNWSKKYNAHWYFKFCTENKFSWSKTEFDKSDIKKLALVPVDLSKLSDVVKMMLLKKLCMINSLQK